CLLDAVQYLARHWPMWNETRGARHIFATVRDGGAVDKMGQAVLSELWSKPAGGAEWTRRGLRVEDLHPLSRTRRCVWLQPHGLHVGVGQFHFMGTFVPGLDINWPVGTDPNNQFVRGLAEEQRRRVLQATQPQMPVMLEGDASARAPSGADGNASEAARGLQAEAMRLTGRSTLVYFRGTFEDIWAATPGDPQKGQRRAVPNLRRLVNELHANATGFDIHNHREAGVKFEMEWEAMSRSLFCLCPPARTGGWSDRCWKAILAGCIPVRLQDDYSETFEELLPWNRFSVAVPEDAVPHLPQTLSQIPTSEILKACPRHPSQPLLILTPASRQAPSPSSIRTVPHFPSVPSKPELLERRFFSFFSICSLWLKIGVPFVEGHS
ncbi:hypothetical protein CYMTET_33019, partial [Cymbomonas tetramitiformis]